MSTKEIADRLEVTPSRIYSWIHKGSQSIPHFRLGRFLRFREEDVSRYLKKKKRPHLIAKRFPRKKIDQLFPLVKDFSKKHRPEVLRSAYNARRRIKRLKANKNVMTKYIAGDRAILAKMMRLYQLAYPELPMPHAP